MNKMSILSKLKAISQIKKINFNIILSVYFMESFLEKLSYTRYKDIFVFKGGFLLSSFLGMENRTTMDIDLSVSNFSLTEEIIHNSIAEIIAIQINSVNFEIQAIERIRIEDRYGGYTIKLIGKLDNIKQQISIDVATGDPITPKAVNYRYKTLLTETVLVLKSYNIETILAEKIETMYSRGIFNSRCKDYYDLYIIYRLKEENIDYEILKEALVNTFAYRKTQFDMQELVKLLKLMKTSEIMRTRWIQFTKKNDYAIGLDYDEMIENLAYFLSKIYLEKVEL